MGLNWKTNPQIFIEVLLFQSQTLCLCQSVKLLSKIQQTSDASEMCLRLPGFNSFGTFLVFGVLSRALKQGPGFCLVWDCSLSWAWQGIAGRGFPPSNPFSWGNEVPRPWCWSSLLSLLGAGSLPLPAGSLPDPARSLLSVWKPPFKTGFFGFRVLFFPNENNPHPVNHHLG